MYIGTPVQYVILCIIWGMFLLYNFVLSATECASVLLDWRHNDLFSKFNANMYFYVIYYS